MRRVARVAGGARRAGALHDFVNAVDVTDTVLTADDGRRLRR